MVDSEQGKIASINKELEKQVGAVMHRYIEALEFLQSNPYLADAGRTPSERLGEMQRLADVYDMFTDISHYDENGLLINSTDEEDTQVLDNTIWFDRARNGERCIASPELVSGSEGLHLSLYLPLSDETGARNVLKGRIPFQDVWDVLDDAQLGDSGYAMLLDPYQNALAHPDHDLIYRKIQPPEGFQTWNDTERGSYTDPDGNRYLYTTRILSSAVTEVGNEWCLVSLVPEKEILGIINRFTINQVCLVGIGVVIALLLGGLFTRTLARPIASTSEAALRVAGGNLTTSLAATGPREITRLCAAFNLMVDKVRSHQENLEDQVQNRTRRLEESKENTAQLAAQLRAAYDATREGILVTGPNREILTANARFSAFFDLDEASAEISLADLRKVLSECCLEGEEFLEIWDAMADDPLAEYEGEILTNRPEERTLAVFTAPVTSSSGLAPARLWMFRDLTQNRDLERGLRQAQKMEAVGRLAGGVAHDFNNLLTGIIGNISLAEGELEDRPTKDGEMEERLSSARKAAARGSELVQGLLGFSRQTNLEFRACDANAVMNDVISLTSASFDPAFKVVAHASDDLWIALADPTEVEQVVMNMCVNARDALGEGGRIQISTSNVEISPETASSIPAAEPGEYVKITVMDDGEGIPEEIRGLIFEPFFTTKEQGKGTGLGLAQCYGIVQQHGGWISCFSESGLGTTFEIFLPRNPNQEEIEEVEELPLAKPDQSDGGKILIVDDEDVVRCVAEGLLKRNGFSTISAFDGEEALRILDLEDHDFDAIMLDMTMPRLCGKETFKGIREAGFTIPVIICSGYLVDLEAFSEEVGYRPEAFVQKPYDIAVLMDVIRQTISDGPQLPEETVTKKAPLKAPKSL